MFILVEEFATITDSISSLRIGETIVLQNPQDLNLVDSTEVVWTKETQWLTVEAQWNSFYNTSAPTEVAYIKAFHLGIVYAKTSFTHISTAGYHHYFKLKTTLQTMEKGVSFHLKLWFCL